MNSISVKIRVSTVLSNIIIMIIMHYIWRHSSASINQQKWKYSVQFWGTCTYLYWCWRSHSLHPFPIVVWGSLELTANRQHLHNCTNNWRNPVHVVGSPLATEQNPGDSWWNKSREDNMFFWTGLSKLSSFPYIPVFVLSYSWLAPKHQCLTTGTSYKAKQHAQNGAEMPITPSK